MRKTGARRVKACRVSAQHSLRRAVRGQLAGGLPVAGADDVPDLLHGPGLGQRRPADRMTAGQRDLPGVQRQHDAERLERVGGGVDGDGGDVQGRLLVAREVPGGDVGHVVGGDHVRGEAQRGAAEVLRLAGGSPRVVEDELVRAVLLGGGDLVVDVGRVEAVGLFRQVADLPAGVPHRGVGEVERGGPGGDAQAGRRDAADGGDGERQERPRAGRRTRFPSRFPGRRCRVRDSTACGHVTQNPAEADPPFQENAGETAVPPRPRLRRRPCGSPGSANPGHITPGTANHRERRDCRRRTG